MTAAQRGLALIGVVAWICVCATAFGDAPSGARMSPRSAATTPSPIVYPTRARGLVMSHDTPAHRELACTRCHESSMAAGRKASEPRLAPREAACAPCHEAAVERTSGDDPNRCALCHRGFDAAQRPALAPARSEPARLHFSHARHARANVPCGTCHGGGGALHMPSMSDCMSCHAGARHLACNGCHLAQPSGVLRTRFPEGKLVPRSEFRGLSHDADFGVRHRWLAADDAATCASCHTEKDCTDCHEGDRRPRSLHPNDYLALHAQDAERNAPRCTSCHTTQSFCLPCHARLGVAPLAAPDLASPRRFHPPGAVWVRGPTQHAREAQRALSTCASCHAESDCIACHAAPGIGAGHSPHPAGFRGECGALLRANSGACAKCHGSLSDLRSRCR
jgi:hypothetical protein